MNDKRPTVIGVTGTIGSGKSLVGRLLEQMSIPVIDTDKVVHDLLNGDTPTRAKVIERFGPEIQQDDGTINRRALGGIVFSDSEARKELEAIVHPAVRTECRRRIDALVGETIVAVLVPLLFEAGMREEYDETWAVVTSEPVLKERLKQRDKIGDEAVERRLRAQWAQSKKAALATFVIDNSNSIEETKKQVELLVRKALTVTRST